LIIAVVIGGIFWLYDNNLKNEDLSELTNPIQIKTKKEKIITAENAISWTSGNNAKVHLIKAELLEENSRKYLDLYFNVETAEGGYCWQSMETYLRTKDKNGGYVNPEKVKANCIHGYSTIKNQMVCFVLNNTQEIFDIYNCGRDVKGSVKMIKLFSVMESDKDLEIFGYSQD